MNTLEELNNYSNEQIPTQDERDFEIYYSDDVPSNANIQIDQGEVQGVVYTIAVQEAISVPATGNVYVQIVFDNDGSTVIPGLEIEGTGFNQLDDYTWRANLTFPSEFVPTMPVANVLSGLANDQDFGYTVTFGHPEFPANSNITGYSWHVNVGVNPVTRITTPVGPIDYDDGFPANITGYPMITHYENSDPNDVYYLEIFPSDANAVSNGNVQTTHSSNANVSWDANAATLYIDGIRSDLNDHLANLVYNSTYGFTDDFLMYYRVTDPFSGMTTVFQQFSADVFGSETANLGIDRSYYAYQSNYIYANSPPTITEQSYDSPEYTVLVTLGSNIGEIHPAGNSLAWNSVTLTYTVTGGKTDVNNLISNVLFWPWDGESGNSTVQYRQYRGNLLQTNDVVNLTGLANPNLAPQFYSFGNDGLVKILTFDNSLLQDPNTRIDMLLVSGGGAAGSTPWNDGPPYFNIGGGGGSGTFLYEQNTTYFANAVNVNANASSTSFTLFAGSGGGNGFGGAGGGAISNGRGQNGHASFIFPSAPDANIELHWHYNGTPGGTPGTNEIRFNTANVEAASYMFVDRGALDGNGANANADSYLIGLNNPAGDARIIINQQNFTLLPNWTSGTAWVFDVANATIISSYVQFEVSLYRKSGLSLIGSSSANVTLQRQPWDVPEFDERWLPGGGGGGGATYLDANGYLDGAPGVSGGGGGYMKPSQGDERAGKGGAQTPTLDDPVYYWNFREVGGTPGNLELKFNNANLEVATYLFVDTDGYYPNGTPVSGLASYLLSVAPSFLQPNIYYWQYNGTAGGTPGNLEMRFNTANAEAATFMFVDKDGFYPNATPASNLQSYLLGLDGGNINVVDTNEDKIYTYSAANATEFGSFVQFEVSLIGHTGNAILGGTDNVYIQAEPAVTSANIQVIDTDLDKVWTYSASNALAVSTYVQFQLTYISGAGNGFINLTDYCYVQAEQPFPWRGSPGLPGTVAPGKSGYGGTTGNTSTTGYTIPFSANITVGFSNIANGTATSTPYSYCGPGAGGSNTPTYIQQWGWGGTPIKNNTTMSNVWVPGQDGLPGLMIYKVYFYEGPE